MIDQTNQVISNKPSDIESNPYLYNLSQLGDFNFIGRKTELKKLIQYISPDYRQHITVVNGVSGIGKTALVVKAANLCQNPSQKSKYLSKIKIPKFVAIIFISINKSYLDFNNEIKKVYKDSVLQYIFKTIAATLKFQHNTNTDKINKSSGEEQIKAVYQCLNQQYSLLIIDNLDATKGQEKDNILLFLSNLPANVQAIITTREKDFSYSPVSLESLSKEEELELIQQQAEKNKVILTDKESQEIYNISRGIPLAIIHAVNQKQVNQINNHSFLEKLFNSTDISHDNQDVVFDHPPYSILKKSIGLLRNEIEQELLISISFFPDFACIEAITKVAGFKINRFGINEGIEKLEQLSLIKQSESKYLMNSITREYLAKEQLQYYYFEKDARERWVKWYLQFAQKYGGRDWKNWRNKYNQLNTEWNNLLAVLEWCAGRGYYESVRDLWQQLNQFANLYEYWNDRIFWLSWLIEESKKREDWKTASYCMSEKGFTLIQMGDLIQAECLLQEALDLVKVFDLSTSENLENQILVCQHFALLYINQGKYQDAYDWLDQVESFAASMSIKPQEKNRRLIAMDTLKAEILFNQKSYQAAKELYEQIVKKSAQIGWQRRKHQAQERISIIESELASNRFRKSSRSFKNSNSNNIGLRRINSSSYYQNLYG